MTWCGYTVFYPVRTSLGPRSYGGTAGTPRRRPWKLQCHLSPWSATAWPGDWKRQFTAINWPCAQNQNISHVYRQMHLPQYHQRHRPIKPDVSPPKNILMNIWYYVICINMANHFIKRVVYTVKLTYAEIPRDELQRSFHVTDNSK